MLVYSVVMYRPKFLAPCSSLTIGRAPRSAFVRFVTWLVSRAVRALTLSADAFRVSRSVLGVRVLPHSDVPLRHAPFGRYPHSSLYAFSRSTSLRAPNAVPLRRTATAPRFAPSAPLRFDSPLFAFCVLFSP